jgi:hypothetical protein
MLPRRSRWPLNEGRILTFDPDEKLGDPHEGRILTFDPEEKPGDPQTLVGLWLQLDERRGSRHSHSEKRLAA